MLDANRSSLDFIGMDLAEVVGLPFCETPWWRDCQTSRDALKDAIRKGLSGVSSRFEARLADKNDEITNVDFSLTPVFDEDGAVAFLVPEARDITAIKESAKALRETEARLRLAYDAAEIGTWDWNLVNNDLVWDERQFELFDISAPRGQMRFEKAINRLHPEDRKRVIATALHSIENNAPYRDEFRVVHGNGDIRWIVSLGKPLHYDENGKPQSMIGVNYDVTDRKNTELELAQINQDLEARVARRTRDLEQEMRERQKAQEALSHAQRLEAIGQLAGGMAHDFNNLLAVISGNLELAVMESADDRIVGLIQEALEAVEAGASLNQRLLSFAQKRSLAPVSFNMNERIEYTKMLLERTLDKNIALETELSLDIHDTCVDPGEFDSALLNLVINARDAMPTGGKLCIAARNLTFSSHAGKDATPAQSGDYVQLSVSDTGTGMAPNVQDKAMTPFFTTKALGKGSGLGLSSVFGFARQSDGFVAIDSIEGQGTTINVNLPRAPSPSSADLPKQPRESMPSGRGELVLVVEDNDALLRITQERVVALGYDAATARTAAEALEILKANETVSLVFSDVRMPGKMSGYDLAAWVSENRPDTRILLTSGFNDGMVGEQEHIKLLAKPYKLKTLAASLRDALA